MLKWIKYFLGIVVIFILVAAGGIAYLTMAYPPEKLAGLLQNQANKHLPGAKMQLGRIEVSFFPFVSCTINDLSLRIKKEPAPFFAMKHLDVRADYASLMADKIHIDHIVIDEPYLHWKDNANAQAFLAGLSNDSTPDVTTAKHSREPSEIPVSIGKIKLRHGQVLFDRPEHNATLHYEDLNIDAALNDEARVAVSFVHQDSNWSIDLPNVSLNPKKMGVEAMTLAVDSVVLNGSIAYEPGDVPNVRSEMTLSALDDGFMATMQEVAQRYQKAFPPSKESVDVNESVSVDANQTKPLLPPLDFFAKFRLDGVTYQNHSFETFAGRVVVRNGKVAFSGGFDTLLGLNDVNATFSLEPEKEMAFKGVFKIADNSPMPLLKLAGLEDVNRSGGIWRNFALGGHVEGNKNVFKLHDSILVLDNTTIELTGQVHNPDNPLAVFQLDIDELNVNPYLASLPDANASDVNTTNEQQPLETMNEEEKADPLEAIRAFGKYRVGGQIKAKSIRFKEYHAKKLLAKFTWKDSRLKLDPFKMKLFDGYFAGKYSADFGKKVPEFHIEHMIRDLKIQKLYDARGMNKKIGGSVELTARIDTKGMEPQALLQSLNGVALLRGKNVTLDGVDIDGMIDTYQTAKYMQLADVALLLTTGPLGGAISMGSRASYLAYNATQGGSTKLKRILAGWKIENGRAYALDVGVKTDHNRIVLKGSIDLVKKHFHYVQVGVLSKNNCAVIKQTLDGPLDSLSFDFVEASSDMLLGSIDTLADISEDALYGCDVFYRGRL